MLISINGTIIDTKNIYQITEIEDGGTGWYFAFNIKFNQKENLRVEIDEDDVNENSRNKITTYRNSIIKIWQENQSEIPQFNL